MFVVGYTTVGPICVTWSQHQQVTWKCFAKYCSEAYAVIDAIDTDKKRAVFGAKRIGEHLTKVA